MLAVSPGDIDRERESGCIDMMPAICHPPRICDATPCVSHCLPCAERQIPHTAVFTQRNFRVESREAALGAQIVSCFAAANFPSRSRRRRCGTAAHW